jgi:hypothetical protein
MSTNVLTLTNDPSKHEEYKTARSPGRPIPLRCARCAGCLFFEPEPLSASVTLTCLSCSRVTGSATVDDLIDVFGIDAATARRVARLPISFVWRRV